jgi:CDP-diacylglycerol--glycerol-3-phosphate 3-phosphatidyltransferase
MAKLSEGRKLMAYYITQPAAELLAKTSIKPNIITWLGFLVTLGAAALIATDHLLAAGVVVLVAGFFDMLDGALARRAKQTTRFGALLDSTLDRLSEGMLLLGILILGLKDQSTAIVLLVFFALIGSLLVSYVKARAESLGLECQVGLFTRGERVPVLALGLLLSQFNYALITALAIIVIFSFITAAQRVLYVWQQTKSSK